MWEAVLLHISTQYKHNTQFALLYIQQEEGQPHEFFTSTSEAVPFLSGAPFVSKRGYISLSWGPKGESIPLLSSGSSTWERKWGKRAPQLSSALRRWRHLSLEYSRAGHVV